MRRQLKQCATLKAAVSVRIAPEPVQSRLARGGDLARNASMALDLRNRDFDAGVIRVHFSILMVDSDKPVIRHHTRFLQTIVN